MPIAPPKPSVSIDAVYRTRGRADLEVCQHGIEITVELDADMVDDLRTRLADIAEQLEAYHHGQERSAYGDMDRLRRQ
jgi:hypothetical protein